MSHWYRPSQTIRMCRRAEESCGQFSVSSLDGLKGFHRAADIVSTPDPTHAEFCRAAADSLTGIGAKGLALLRRNNRPGFALANQVRRHFSNNPGPACMAEDFQASLSFSLTELFI